MANDPTVVFQDLVTSCAKSHTIISSVSQPETHLVSGINAKPENPITSHHEISSQKSKSLSIEIKPPNTISN
ncbi:hypothetical protein L2E82_25082 [Cichorium intybus]|uniref:Uncharacterized protein n=1 Tax=Cichorium intybus TaxID=13427 RepID=A0ACB9E230_CICIN|nr:hypothetical protein L2E82_25082 [Cichorium intybus]